MPELSIQTQNEEGDSVTRTVHVEEEHADEARETITSLATQAEEVPALREERDELSSENEALREKMVGEIVRRKKLAGEIDGEDEVKTEREFLSGLPAERLSMHYDRALKLNVDTDGALDAGKSPDDNGDGTSYDDVGL